MPTTTTIINGSPELQPLLLNIKIFGKSRNHEPIYQALEGSYLDFSDSDKLAKFMSAADNAVWLVRFVTSEHQRAKFFFDAVSVENAVALIDSIQYELDNDPKPRIDNANNALMRISTCCYILFICVKKFKLPFAKLLESLQNYVDRMGISDSPEKKFIQTQIKQQLSKIDCSNYMTAIYAMIAISAHFMPRDIAEVLDVEDCLNFADQDAMNGAFLDAPLFWIDFFALNLKRSSRFLVEANPATLNLLVEMTVAHIIEKNQLGLTSLDEVKSRLHQAILLYKLIYCDKYIPENSYIENIIFCLLATPIKSFTNVPYVFVDEHFKSLEKVIMDFLRQRGSVTFVDNNQKSLLHYVESRNSKEFVGFLFEHGAILNFKDNNGVSAVISIFCLHDASNRFVEIIKNKIIQLGAEGEAILEYALQDCYRNYNLLKNLGYEPRRVMPLLLKLLFETSKDYENLELSFSDICLWNIENLEQNTDLPFTNEELLRRMFKALARPHKSILAAINKVVQPDQFNKCLLALLKSPWPDNSNAEQVMHNLQIWQFLAENPEQCTTALALACSATSANPDPLSHAKFSKAIDANKDLNPFTHSVAHKNIEFLVFALAVFHGSDDLLIAKNISHAATEMIDNGVAEKRMRPLFEKLTTLKPQSFFYHASPFVTQIRQALKNHMQTEQGLRHCLPTKRAVGKKFF